MSSPFKFKQFVVHQEGAPMKINTDGVLLAAMAEPSQDPILDVGTGTGVIAMMLAQRFPHMLVDAIEPDEAAYRLARANFEQSPFYDRLKAYQVSLEAYDMADDYYGLIVSNPPYFLQSLKSPDPRKSMARHGNTRFFKCLLEKSVSGLRQQGKLQLIVPSTLSPVLLEMAAHYGLQLAHSVQVCSFVYSKPFRDILVFSKVNDKKDPTKAVLVLYEERGIYTTAYRILLKDFFIHF